MLQVEYLLKKAADPNVEVLTVGADAKFWAYAEISGENDARNAGHRECRAKIFGAVLTGGDGLSEARLIGSGEHDRTRDFDGRGIVVAHEEQTKVAGRLWEMKVIAQRSPFDSGLAVDNFRCPRQRQTDAIVVRVV